MSNFFYISSNLIFSKKTMRKLSLIIFLCFHIIIIIFVILKSNFTKEKRIYEYVWTYFI